MCKENCKYWSTMVSYTAWRKFNPLPFISFQITISLIYPENVEIVIPFGYGISGESVAFFFFFDLFLQLCNVKSSLNSIRDTKFVAQLLKTSPPPPQAHSPSCRQSRASGFISSKADISRLVCSVHCRQYWLTRPLCEPVGIGMVQATFWAARLLSCYCVNYLSLWD